MVCQKIVWRLKKFCREIENKMPITLKDFGLSINRILMFFALSLAAGVLEGFGLAMFLPVLQFIEKGQNIDMLRESSGLWEYLVLGYGFFNLKITLLSLSSVLMMLMLLRVVFIYLRQIFIAWFSQEIRHQTRSNLFDALVKAEYKFFDDLSTGEVVSLASNETVRTSSYFSALFQVFSNFAVLVGMFCVLSWISWSMTLLVLGLMVVGGVGATIAMRHTKKVSVQTTISNKEMSFVLIEKLTTIRLLKLSGYNNRESKLHRDASAKVKKHLFVLIP